MAEEKNDLSVPYYYVFYPKFDEKSNAVPTSLSPYRVASPRPGYDAFFLPEPFAHWAKSHSIDEDTKAPVTVKEYPPIPIEDLPAIPEDTLPEIRRQQPKMFAPGTGNLPMLNLGGDIFSQLSAMHRQFDEQIQQHFHGHSHNMQTAQQPAMQVAPQAQPLPPPAAPADNRPYVTLDNPPLIVDADYDSDVRVMENPNFLEVTQLDNAPVPYFPVPVTGIAVPKSLVEPNFPVALPTTVAPPPMTTPTAHRPQNVQPMLQQRHMQQQAPPPHAPPPQQNQFMQPRTMNGPPQPQQFAQLQKIAMRSQAPPPQVPPPQAPPTQIVQQGVQPMPVQQQQPTPTGQPSRIYPLPRKPLRPVIKPFPVQESVNSQNTAAAASLAHPPASPVATPAPATAPAPTAPVARNLQPPVVQQPLPLPNTLAAELDSNDISSHKQKRARRREVVQNADKDVRVQSLPQGETLEQEIQKRTQAIREKIAELKQLREAVKKNPALAGKRVAAETPSPIELVRPQAIQHPVATPLVATPLQESSQIQQLQMPLAQQPPFTETITQEGGFLVRTKVNEFVSKGTVAEHFKTGNVSGEPAKVRQAVMESKAENAKLALEDQRAAMQRAQMRQVQQQVNQQIESQQAQPAFFIPQRLPVGTTVIVDQQGRQYVQLGQAQAQPVNIDAAQFGVKPGQQPSTVLAVPMQTPAVAASAPGETPASPASPLRHLSIQKTNQKM